MKKVYTKQVFDKIMADNNFTLLDGEIYDKFSKAISFKDNDGYFYKMPFCRLRRVIKEKIIPNKFGKNNPYTIHNIDIWLSLNTDLSILSDVYVEGNSLLKFECKNCLKIFKARWSSVLGGFRCVECSKKQPDDKNSFVKLCPDIAKEWDFIKNNGVDINSIFYRSGKKFWWICSTCGHSYESNVQSRTSRNRGCPKCSGRIVSDKNRLSILFPEICKEWDYEKIMTFLKIIRLELIQKFGGFVPFVQIDILKAL